MIHPFDAWQYDPKTAGAWDTLCCPPYDVVSEAEQRALEALNPYNCIQLERPLGNDPYNRAAKLLDEWRRAGVLKRAGAEAYFVYEMSFSSGGAEYTLRGFTGRCELTPFSEGRVLPHEETLSKAKADRMELMLAAKCNFSPIYMLYSDPGRAAPSVLEQAVSGKAPDAEFAMDGVTHRMWRADDADVIRRITAAMADKKLYIADGHHRYETALAYHERVGTSESKYVMATFFDMENPGLVVLPTHRVIRGCDPGACDSLLQDDGFIVKSHEPGRAAEGITLYANGSAWLIAPRDPDAVRRALPNAGDAYRGLDVAVLHAMILEPRFGIGAKELAEQKNITYTRDTDEAMRMVDGGRGQCAFLLPHPKVSQIRDVSLEGGKMPQKSTYFYPKLITGLYINGLGPGLE